MGANNSTRRVSFESDENDNVTVVKGIRLSENVIKRMKEPAAPPTQQQPATTPSPPAAPASPLQRPVPPLFEPITSFPPPPPPLVEPVAPPAPPQSATESVAAPPPPVEKVTAPIIADIVPPSSFPPAAAVAAAGVVAPAVEPVATPSPVPASVFAPADPLLPSPCPTPAVVEVVAPLAPPPPLVGEQSPLKNESTASSLPLAQPVAPPNVAEPFTPSSVAEPLSPPFPAKTELITSPPLLTDSEPLSSPSVFESVNFMPPQPAKPFVAPPLPEFNAPCEPVAPPPPPPQPKVEPVPKSKPVPPPPAASVADEEALRKKIADELYKDLKQERAKVEQELQAWVEAEKARASTQAHAEAKSQVHGEVSRLLSEQRAAVQESLQQAFIRERIAAEDEKLRAHLLEIGRKAKQVEAKEADLKKQDAFYREQVARLEERSSQFYKVTTENFHKAADQVNAKFRRYEAYPVCADLQEQILTCYKENVGKTLHCSNIAARYLQCVNDAKQNDKFVHAPSRADNKTS
ncbi:coiled-coil-helix-coiled-coil-helix domain containing 3a isoform X1 [Haplochromis burtoni]|uniref:coiled-coil-helix-coiled-coil-helix domain containing 3a isoform X1 n=1 Tax=Haplochromis burtoni TaxID=8153 RepID=UPI001C2DADC2|nr:coiled-coil-helix-coiled-coil-helix domain containing 3a isoform X1 [Haplochromis burtoni]